MSSTSSEATPRSSVTRLPTGLLGLNRDILVTIMQYCLSQDDSESVEIPPVSQSQRLILCQICQSLRSLIHTSPIFWTKFTFTTTRLGQHRNLIKEWLGRGDVPPSSFPISIKNREESEFSVAELEDFIFPHSSRLLRLHLYLTYEALERFFNFVPPLAFPRLIRLSILCDDFQQPSLLDVQPVLFGSPLAEFTLSIGPPVLVRGLGISWSELTTLHLTISRARFFFPISWIHTILSACRASLDTCSISIEPTTDPDLHRLCLPLLKNLSLHFRDSGWKTQAGVLGFLSLPSLLSLELSREDGLAFNEACSALKSFFHRAQNIQRLRFERTPAPGTGFSATVNSLEAVNILKLLSSLRSIHLPKGQHTNIMMVIEAVLLRNICPLLESIEMMVDDGLQVIRIIQVLWDEVKGMTGGSSRNLKSIHLVDPQLSWTGTRESWSTDSDPDNLVVFNELKERGLVIYT